MTSKLRTWLPEIVTALFILLFVYTALNKLQYFDGFIAGLERNPLLADHKIIIGWLVPLTELAITVLLLVPATRRSGLLAATLLMLAFATFIGYMMLTRSKLPCICGGIFNTMPWDWHLLINLFFVVIGTISVIIYDKPFLAINRSSRTPVEHSRHH